MTDFYTVNPDGSFGGIMQFDDVATIPAGVVDVAPPLDVPDGKRILWGGHDWHVVDEVVAPEIPAPSSPAPATLVLIASSYAIQVDAQVTVTARLLDSDGQPVPITETFLVPVFNDSGVVAAIKGVSFVDGVAETVLTFKSSGYYRITEAGINSRLAGLRISLPQPFELTVYEA